MCKNWKRKGETMIVKIDDDCVDKIVQAALMDTYLRLKKDLKLATKNPENYHPDDVENWAKVVVSIEALGEWFFYDFPACVKRAKKTFK